MIIVDWGNYEENLIVLRVEGQWNYPPIKTATSLIAKMVTSKANTVNLLVDVRRADPIPASIMSDLYRSLENRTPDLQQVIVIMSAGQENTLRLIANFYPGIVEEISVVRSVEQAYQMIHVA